MNGAVNLLLGDDVRIFGNTVITSLRKGARLSIGSGTHIGYGVTIRTSGETSIGSRAFISNGVIIGAERGSLGQSSQVLAIGDDVWIGAGSTILDGVTIGRGAVVTAGAIVAEDVPAYSMVGGNPNRMEGSGRLTEGSGASEAA